MSRILTFKVASVQTGERQFVGSNAYGAKAAITSNSFVDYELGVAPESPFLKSAEQEMRHSLYRLQSSFEVAPEDPRSLKPFLRIAFTCRLADSHVYRDTVDTTATMTSPYEIHIKKFRVLVLLASVACIDSQNGHVWAELSPA
jgi:hypothetical protein